MKRSVLATCLGVLVLTGCAGPAYWHEPPGSSGSTAQVDRWLGLARNGPLRHYSHDNLRQPIVVRCASYADRISLTRDGEVLQVSLGTDPVLQFDTHIDESGRFSRVQPVSGDTWIYGGVMIFDETPELHFWGQLNEDTGLGAGRINVSPGDERYGCTGYFQVSRNSMEPDEEARGQPFRVRYWIEEVDRSDDPWIFGLHRERLPRFLYY